MDRHVNIKPLLINNKLLTPVVAFCKKELENNSEFIDIRFYKNKVKLIYFLDGSKRLDLVSYDKRKIFTLNEDIEFHKPMAIDEYEEVREIKRMYNPNTTEKVISELLNRSIEDYNYRKKEYNDDDYYESILTIYNQMIKENSNNQEEIFILNSFVDYAYKNVYFDIFQNLLCK